MDYLTSIMSVQCGKCASTLSFRYDSCTCISCPQCGALTDRKKPGDYEGAEMAPETASVIQPGTKGTWNEKNFEVTGRLFFRFEDESYVNWWHLQSGSNSFGWIAESYGTYRIMQPSPDLVPVSKVESLKPGGLLKLQKDETFYLHAFATTTEWSAEGELPFFPDQIRFMWIDFNGAKVNEGIDVHIFSRSKAEFYRGQDVEAETIRLNNLRKADGWNW